MASMQGFVFAITLGTVAARTPYAGGCYAITSAADCCAHTDGRTEPKFAGQDCVPSTAGEKFHSSWTCEPACFVDGTGCDGEGEDDSAKIAGCVVATTTPAPTTQTPWDSSASSSEDSNSLESSCSSSFRKPWESSTSSTDSSTDNSGSMESGSSGCYPSLPVWPFIICPLIPLCLAPLIPLCKPKPKPPKKRPQPKPEPKPEPLPEVVLPTTLLPVQQYAPMPITTSVQQPMFTSAYAAPVTTAYAEPLVQAAPLMGTASYAMPAYGTGYGSYPAGGVY